MAVYQNRGWNRRVGVLNGTYAGSGVTSAIYLLISVAFGGPDEVPNVAMTHIAAVGPGLLAAIAVYRRAQRMAVDAGGGGISAQNVLRSVVIPPGSIESIGKAQVYNGAYCVKVRYRINGKTRSVRLRGLPIDDVRVIDGH